MFQYDSIPVETSDGCPPPAETFSVETVGRALMDNLVRCCYTKPTPVQKYSIPIGMAGQDMMACAQTGSGKTAGFLFPVISLLLREGPPPVLDHMPPDVSAPVALVLAPTRELVSQIFDEAQKFCYCSGLRPVVVYGGADIRQQKRELERGCDILVATPGRLMDLMDRGYISLRAIRFLVLDEADRMLDMGFEPQIRKIVSQIRPDRQTLMWSATWPKEVQQLARDFLVNPYQVTVGSLEITANKNIRQIVEVTSDYEKYGRLTHYLRNELDRDSKILIFVETKKGCDQLTRSLRAEGFPARAIHGDKSQADRDFVLREFRDGAASLLIATDVAARGLDVKDVRAVVNFDFPSGIEDYVHRIGRSGRAGAKGLAISFMTEKHSRLSNELLRILRESENEVPRELEALAARSGRGGGFGGGRPRYRNQFGR